MHVCEGSGGDEGVLLPAQPSLAQQMKGIVKDRLYPVSTRSPVKQLARCAAQLQPLMRRQSNVLEAILPCP